MHALKAAGAAALMTLAGCATSGNEAPGKDAAATSMTLGYAASAGRSVTAFRKQTPKVAVECFPKELRAVLGQIHARFGVKPVVTSGHRPRAGRSQHAHCKAADIRVPGVSPSAVARYARTIKGIGGVGTYRNKGIVHVDVGPRRDWRY